MTDCIFCKIRDGVVSSEKVYEDELMFIIRDIEPKARRHFLMIPKRHFKLLSQMTADDAENLGKCLRKLPELSSLLGLENGYRLVINQGDDAGQTVFHLHVHILCGQTLDFPDLRS